MQTRCPDCDSSVEVLGDDPLVELQCASCGSSFNLWTAATDTYGAGEIRTIGHFELLEKLGQGSFGSVWKARDRDLDRIVAVKLPRREQLDRVEAERFLREARTAAQLNHPGIVAVHEVGNENGQIYIVSDYVQGATLAEWIESRPLHPREAAELVARVADALEHAHQRGVVHRDVKPGNILLELEPVESPESDRVQSSESRVQSQKADRPQAEHSGSRLSTLDPRPKVTDFGLAKRDVGEVTMTVEGQVLGSPSYMSPEQARGEGHGVDARSDVYSLGVVLFELLTGERPFRGSARMMIVQILTDEPPSPRRLKAGIPRDLETITLRCLQKDPSRRYQSARELAADLRRFLAGEPIQARPVGRLERTWRWCRRNPLIAALAASTALLLVAVAVVSAVFAVRQARLAKSEHDARTRAESHLAVALDAVNRLLAEVGRDELNDVPQMEPVRRKLLQDAVALTQELRRHEPDDPRLRSELAAAYDGLADLYRELGEHEAARSAYEEAIGMYSRLANEFPHSAEYRLKLSISHTYLGELFRTGLLDNEAAERNYLTARKLQDELRSTVPNDRRIRHELTRTWNNYGLLLMETGRPREAEKALGEAVSGLLALTGEPGASASGSRGKPEPPHPAAYAADLARTRINLGNLLKRDLKRPDEARVEYENAARLLRMLLDRQPENRGYRHKLAVSLLDLGNLLLQSADERNHARQQLAESVRRLQSLVEDFPGIVHYRSDLAKALNSLAIAEAHEAGSQAQLGNQRFDDAESHWREALGVLQAADEKFPEAAPDSPEFQSVRGIVFGGLGWLEHTRKNHEQARRNVEQAIEHQWQAVRAAPKDPVYRGNLAGHYTFLAEILLALERTEEAVRRLREGVEAGVVGPDALQADTLRPLSRRNDFQGLLKLAARRLRQDER